jgi:hypothetical protein
MLVSPGVARMFSARAGIDWFSFELGIEFEGHRINLVPHLTEMLAKLPAKLLELAFANGADDEFTKLESERRSYISSRALSAAAFAAAARGHWAIENKLHWVVDVTFGEDLSPGHGAKNMAVVRHFALDPVRQVADKRSIKRRRKRAAWDPQYLLDILGPLQSKPC